MSKPKYQKTESHYYDGEHWRTVKDKELDTEAEVIAELERLSRLSVDLYEVLSFLRELSSRRDDMAKVTRLMVNYAVLALYHPALTGPGSASHYEAELREAGVDTEAIWSTGNLPPWERDDNQEEDDADDA